MLKNTLKSIFKNVLKFQTEKYLVYCSCCSMVDDQLLTVPDQGMGFMNYSPEASVSRVPPEIK
jgi:hypothetical protein